MPQAGITKAIVRIGRAVRDGWILAGITILMLLLIDTIYRAQAEVKRLASPPAVTQERKPEPPSPFDTTAWAAEYLRDKAREEAVEWAPYTYVRNPTFTGRYISVDSLGHRVTPLPPSKGRRVLRVFFLGGSTTFGWFHRNEFTLPAEAARRLQSITGDSIRLEVTNFGVPGFVFTQELLELVLQLRAGGRPDVVVFYDGINDVISAIQSGTTGLPQNESNRAEDFRNGRLLAAEHDEGFRNDLRLAKRLLSSALLRLQFAQRIVDIKRPKPAPPVPIDSLASKMVQTFAGNARVVEALAKGYGFEAIYVWQPALLSTKKPLTPREQWLLVPQRIGYLHQAVPPLLGPAMKSVAGDRFIDATTIFDSDSGEIFLDMYGHTYERANIRIADTLMTVLGPAVRRAAARAGSSAADSVAAGERHKGPANR